MVGLGVVTGGIDGGENTVAWSEARKVGLRAGEVWVGVRMTGGKRGGVGFTREKVTAHTANRPIFVWDSGQ